jgi:hypothetical protein
LKLHIEIEEFEKPLSVQIDREFQYWMWISPDKIDLGWM